VIGWCKGEGGVRDVALPALDPGRAAQLLAGWVREALAEPRWTLMPLEAVLDLHPQGLAGEAPMAAWIAGERDGGVGGFSSRFGPLPRAVDAPAEPAWRELAQARMGPFLDWLGAWEEQP